MSTKLYIGNLDYSVTDDQLAELFAQAGSVASAVVITERKKQKKRLKCLTEKISKGEV